VESQEPSEEMIGHSLGTGPACYIASTKLVFGLILQSAFTSLPNLIEEKNGILSMLINSPCFDNLQAMKHISMSNTPHSW
jgi:hypothetical protein